MKTKDKKQNNNTFTSAILNCLGDGLEHVTDLVPTDKLSRTLPLGGNGISYTKFEIILSMGMDAIGC